MPTLGKLKVVCISDTHCQLDKVKVPKGDILIHAGDLTYRGTVSEILRELNILETLPHEHKILISGNHDWLQEENPKLMKQMCDERGITLLHHEAVTIEGINFFGSGYSPEFGNWALNVPRGKELAKLWADIPDDTNVLITHGPPYGIMDRVPRGELVGCLDLLARIHKLPALTHHVFGHIHEGAGQRTIGKVTYVNASSCTGDYKPTNKPIVVKL